MRALSAALLLLSLPAHAASVPPLTDIAPTPGPIRARLLPQIQAEAARQGVPPALADAVATVETNYTADALGSSGEIGLMQVMPTTALGLGFHGSMRDLFDTTTNIHYGVSYLARAWAASGGNPCRALMKYRAGVGEEGFSPLSIQYCQRATAWLRTQDKDLAEKVASTTPAAPTVSDPYVTTLSGRRPHRIDLAAFAELAGSGAVQLDGGGAPVAAWHINQTGHGSSKVQAVLDAAQDGDPHVVAMPAADN